MKVVKWQTIKRSKKEPIIVIKILCTQLSNTTSAITLSQRVVDPHHIGFIVRITSCERVVLRVVFESCIPSIALIMKKTKQLNLISMTKRTPPYWADHPPLCPC